MTTANEIFQKHGAKPLPGSEWGLNSKTGELVHISGLLVKLDDDVTDHPGQEALKLGALVKHIPMELEGQTAKVKDLVNQGLQDLMRAAEEGVKRLRH